MGASSVINIKEKQNWVNEAKEVLDKVHLIKFSLLPEFPGL